MYFPTRSASSEVEALTLLWTEKPEWRQEKLFPHPLAPLLKPLGMARRAESAAATGEVEEKFRTTVRTANPGKPAAWVAAVQIFSDHLFDDGSEEAVLSFEAALILRQELIEAVEQHTVEDGAFWMSTDTGTTTPRSGGEPVKFNLKWLIVLERQTDVTWKWIYEMWNDNNLLPETPEKEQQD